MADFIPSSLQFTCISLSHNATVSLTEKE